MNEPVIRARALERRKNAEGSARALGIDEELISNMVERFYVLVRTDPVLGPVFDDAIGNRWDTHMARMKEFWRTVLLHNGAYKGNPVQVHSAITAMSRDQFPIWLGLFEKTLDEVSPCPGASDHILRVARNIAGRLQGAIFEGHSPLSRLATNPGRG